MARRSTQIPVRDIAHASPLQRLPKPIVLRRLAEMTTAAPLDEPPHRHDFHFAFFLADGHGHHLIDGRRHEVLPGSLFLMTPGQVHEHFLARGSSGYLLAFTPTGYVPDDTMRSAVAQLFRRDVVRLSPKLTTRAVARAEDLSAALADARAHPGEVRACLELLLLAWSRGIPRESSPTTGAAAHDLVTRYTHLLEAHFAERAPVEWYARALSVSADTLTRKLVRARNQTPAALQRARLLLEAERLLRYTTLDVAEVGYRLGFRDASHFGRVFRGGAGLSPGAWRAQQGH